MIPAGFFVVLIDIISASRRCEMQEILTQEVLTSEDIKELILMNDLFMSACLKNPKCVELVLRIILNRKDLHVKEVKTQYNIESMGRSLRLDVLAEDDEGRLYNIEIQRTRKGADVKRGRYHAAHLDCISLRKGESFDKLCENYVIFITEYDVLGGNLPLYTIDRVIKENGRDFNDGSHIIYVNASHRDLGTALGRLMHDFFEPDPNKMYYEELADEAKYLKNLDEGVTVLKGDYQDTFDRGTTYGMKLGLEQGKAEGRIEGRAEGRLQEKESTVINMLKAGELTLEKIVQYSGLALSRVQEIANSMGITIA